MSRPDALMRNLTNDELLRMVQSDEDPITTTDLERALTTRLRDAQDEITKLETMRDAFGDYEPTDIKELLETLSEFNAESQDSLRDKLKRADEFYDIAQDAGDFLERMNNLVKTTL